MKPQDLKCFQQVADVIGPEYAEYELQRVIEKEMVKSTSQVSIMKAINWQDSPQGFIFWGEIYAKSNPYRGHPKPNLKPNSSGNQLNNKYARECKGVMIDVYDVLAAFGVTNPADQHAIKKMLMPGKRGHKDAIKDRKEAISSLERAIQIEGAKKLKGGK